MSTITIEQLHERACEKVKSLEFAVTQTAFADSRAELEEELELARIALASLEADVVAWTDEQELRDVEKYGCGYLFTANPVTPNADPHRVIKLYAAPPAPVSVPDAYVRDGRGRMMLNGRQEPRIGYSAGWNACRAAMLQGAENAETPTTIQTAPALDSLPKKAESRSSNSPVIPDGWVLVPVEPTEKMIIEGFESEPDEFFSDSEVWEAYDAMSGCQQAAHRAKLCWAAMIAAAPQQEAKNV